MKGHLFKIAYHFRLVTKRTRTSHHRISINLCNMSCLYIGERWCTACMYSKPHGNVVRKYTDATCSCFGQHVNKAQERPLCPESELGLHVGYRRDIHVKWPFYPNVRWILLSSNYHTILQILLKAAIKRYMSALSGDTRTKLIGYY